MASSPPIDPKQIRPEAPVADTQNRQTQRLTDRAKALQKEIIEHFEKLSSKPPL